MSLHTRNNPSERTNSKAARSADHPELRGPRAHHPVLEASGRGPCSEDSTTERDLSRFKRLRFCTLQMGGLAREYGAAAIGRPEYRQYSELHRKLQNEIAHDNLGLVYGVYRRSRFTNMDPDDLMSEGMLALTRAISSFDPWRGFRFSTYAWNVIVRALHARRRRESRRRKHSPVSFESELEKGDLAQSRHNEESGLMAERLAMILEDGNAHFTPTERDVISRRFPIDPNAERPTLDAVGREVHLSKERVRQIQNAALKKLRRALDADPVLN